MSPDPFFHPEVEQSCKSASDCPTSCHWAGQSGFCGARIDPDCLRIGADGAVRVGLSASADEWFGFLNGLGTVLRTSHNGTAVLGQLASVPSLTGDDCPALPNDRFGLYTPNLAEHASLWAVRETSPAGVQYGLEVRDVSGYVFQRFILTSLHQREWFEQFVTEHQSPPDEASHWFAPNHNASFQRVNAISTRSQVLRSRGTTARPLSVEVITRLVMELAKASFLIRTTHFSRGLICAVIWKPSRMEPASFDQDTLNLANEKVILSLHRSTVGEVWLWQGNCGRCSQQRWAIEIMGQFGNVAVMFSIGHPAVEPNWRQLLGRILD